MKLQLRQIAPQLCVLFCLFNCALAMHLGSGGWKFQKTITFIVLMMGLQFLNYRFWKATLLSIIGFTIVSAPIFPRLANHANLEFIIGLILLVLLCIYQYKKSKKEEWNINPQVISNTFRYALITLYFIAGFHKLNSGFFSITGSCAEFVGNHFHSIIFPEGFKTAPEIIRFFQILTIIVEMLIPFGLLHYKTRKPTAIILVAFHFYLSLTSFANFSAFAGFLITGSLISFKSVEYIKHITKGLRIYILFTICAVITSYFITRFELVNVNLIRFYNAVIFNIGWAVFFSIFIYNLPVEKEKSKLLTIPTIVVVFITLWGLQCYAGLSNAGNLTMFSNLVTEKSRNNHFLIDTRKTKMCAFEEDYITILELPEEYKWESSQKLINYDLPVIEFKTQVAEWIKKTDRKIRCVVKYKGETIIIDDLKASEFGNAKWWYRYLFYRKIAPKGSVECLW